MLILKKTGVNWKESKLIKKLYTNQEVKVRIGNETTQETDIGQGLRQRVCMSTMLFNIYL